MCNSCRLPTVDFCSFLFIFGQECWGVIWRKGLIGNGLQIWLSPEIDEQATLQQSC